jgi:redox-sensitive bicupin YhaK (pirin superfamily)
MITIRKSNDRGHADHGWLNTHHTFSFGDYRDPKHMHFRSLRVINEDYVAPGQGFGMHPHQDMEILTWIVSGALQHKDSMGNGEVIRPGDLQHMTAGTGILHSEFNPSQTDPVHLLQIWIMPEKRGLPPLYSQMHFPVTDRTNRLRVLASRDGRDGSLHINQDATLMASVIEPKKTVSHDLAKGRSAWVQVVSGPVEVNGQQLASGDAAALTDESAVTVKAISDHPAEVLLFDLA